MKTKTYLLLDTSSNIEYSDYVENCEANGIEAQDENSNDFYDFCNDIRNMEYEDFEYNCNHSSECDTPVLITGNLGLWNGNPSINPIRCENLLEAIHKCINDMDDFDVTFNNGVIIVNCHHHDGTNYFEIHKRSKKGIMVSDNWPDVVSNSDTCKKYMLTKFNELF